MSSKNIGIREEVYERLKAHKRGDESFSDTLDRLLHDVDADVGESAATEIDEAFASIRAFRETLEGV